MRPLLAIETSGPSLGVALRAETGSLFEENVTAGSIHGRALAPLIARALAASGLRSSELEAVAVSLGPGSWTGLRIGLSAAKALAWGAGIKLVGVPSFKALALDSSRRAPGCALLLLRDARSAGFFCALFGNAPAGEAPAPAFQEQWLPETVLKLPELLETAGALLARHSAPLAVCGDRSCRAMLKEAAQQRGWTLRPDCEYISAGAVAECGWESLSKLERGPEVLESAAEIHKLAPLYLRASDPELKLGLRQEEKGTCR